MLETHEIETGPHPRTTLIVLHGLGADGFDFVPICGELNLAALGSVRYVFPHAPTRPVTINGGYTMRAWYDILVTDLVRHEDETGLRQSQQQIAELIDREREHRRGGAVGLSGYLPLAALTTAERSEANADLPVFMAHGTQDPIVPHARGAASRDALRALGHEVAWQEYPMPHSVCAEEIEALNAWLLKQLG
jgi:phospholipase/carboxylesterase